MAELWAAGVRGNALDVVSAWKDVAARVALVLVIVAGAPAAAVRRRRTDWLALAFAGFVVLYALLPQSWLDGGATHPACCSAPAHDSLPVAAYFLGRGLDLTAARAATGSVTTILATAAAVAAFGLVDIYAIPLSWWRDSGAPGWFHRAARLRLPGLSGLPENFVYNTRQRASAAAPRLDVPLAARDARTCSWSRCSSRAWLALAPRGWMLVSGSGSSRCSSPGCSGRTRARRTSRSRSASSVCSSWRRVRRRAAAAFWSPRRGRRSVGSAFVGGLPAHRRRDARSRRTELRDAARATRPPQAAAVSNDATSVDRIVEHASHWRASATASGRCSTTRRASASATPARPRRAPASRSRPASRPTPSSASRPGLLGGLVFVAWSLALLVAAAPVAPGSRPRSSRCSRSGCRPT